MKTPFVLFGAGCALVGALAIIFAVGAGDWFVRTVARETIKNLVAPTFETVKEGAAKCSAYDDEYKWPFTLAKRKWKGEDFEDDDGKPACESSSRTHYYLYHLTNEAGVLAGDIPIVEQRGPWIFKSEYRGYTLEDEGKGKLSETSRSWKMIDDEQTKKACPKCATDKLCASWDYSTASDSAWPTKCVNGTLSGDAAYNAITHPNPGYLGLLNTLDLLAQDEKLMIYLFGGGAMSKLLGPTALLAQASTYQTIDAAMFVGGLQVAFGATFETHFRASSFPASTAAGIKLAFDKLNIAATTLLGAYSGKTANASLANIDAGAYAKLFGGLGDAGKLSGVSVALNDPAGIGFWLLEAASVASGKLCVADTQSTSYTLFANAGLTFAPRERCALALTVAAINTALEALLDTGNWANQPALQWAQNGFKDKANKGNCSSVTDDSMKYTSPLLVVAPEFSCFLSASNIGTASLVPRLLSVGDLSGWNVNKANQIFWMMTGGNLTDNGKLPIQKAPEISGLSLGWAGLRWAALVNAYEGVKGLEFLFNTFNLGAATITLDLLKTVFWNAKYPSLAYANATAAGVYASLPANVKGGATLDQVCASAFQTALTAVGDTDTAAQFAPSDPETVTCKELQTLVSYTYYVTEKFAVDGVVKYPSCSSDAIQKNKDCSGCKAYKGCVATPASEYPDDEAQKIGFLNCSTACDKFKPCYFNGLGGTTNPLADRSAGKKGGMFFTLEAQSIFTGWTDAIVLQLEDQGIDAGTPSRTTGIINHANTPYQAAGTWHDHSCWEQDAFVESTKEEAPKTLGQPARECQAPDDAARATNYKASMRLPSDKWEKPCHYKKKSYYSSTYAFREAGPDKLLQTASVGGMTKVKGRNNLADPFGSYFDPTVDLWGEEVKIEGYGSNFLPPVMVPDNNKIFFELQNKGVSLDKVEALMEEANKKNKDLFPKEYPVWAGPLHRSMNIAYKEMVALKGEMHTVSTRRFAPTGFTKFTKNTLPAGQTWATATYDEKSSVSADLFEGLNQNPACFVNMKKQTNLNIYVGNRNFHGCSVDSATKKFDKFSVKDASVSAVLYKAKIVDANNAEITTSSMEDETWLAVEPVTGKALKGQVTSGIYTKLRPAPVYSPNVKQTIVPYYSTKTVTSATPEELDTIAKNLGGITDLISLVGAILWSCGCVFFIIGVLSVLFGLFSSTKEKGTKPKNIVPNLS